MRAISANEAPCRVAAALTATLIATCFGVCDSSLESRFSTPLAEAHVFGQRGEDIHAESREDPLDPVLEKMKEEWEKQVQEAQKGSTEAARPLMSAINAMRADLCWHRPDIWAHEKCLKFLGLLCATASTGHGTCSSFRESAKENCKTIDTAVEEQVCGLLKSLKIIAEDDGAKTEEGTQAEKDNVPNSEQADTDQDGVPDNEDQFPHDKTEWADMDKDGIGDNSDEDIDGDGALNKDDAFPRDATEWNDMDGDGIGDNSDTDRDGDGVANDMDKFPDDPTKHGDSEGTHDPSTHAADRDNDGFADDNDEFPDDPAEWKDTDKDGIGDNADPAPFDANCWTAPCPAEASPMKGDNATNATVDAAEAVPATYDSEEAVPATYDSESELAADPTHSWADKLNKVERGLPPDGYDEHTPGLVEHNDMETMTRDWREEWPQLPESDRASFRRICAMHPRNTWCRRFGFSL